MLRSEIAQQENNDDILVLSGLNQHEMSQDEFEKLLSPGVNEANRKLDISNNYLCSFGVKLPEIVQKFPNGLEYLSLKDNFLADLGLPLLLKTLRALPAGLKRVDLRGNKLERLNMYAFSEILSAISPNVEVELGNLFEDVKEKTIKAVPKVATPAPVSTHVFFKASDRKKPAESEKKPDSDAIADRVERNRTK